MTTERHGVLFGTLRPDGEVTNVRVIHHADIARCPHLILVPDHYREDGTCRCDDPDAPSMATGGYVWSDEAGRWEAPAGEEDE